MAEPGKKEIVRAPKGSAKAGEAAAPPADWKPTPEAKGQATKLRLIAVALWVLAIAGELFTILWVLKQDPISTVLLVALIVVIGALAIGGSFLWKRANRLDPAKKSDTVRFFVQNQLGAIIAVVAFLPLIILIFTNKDLDSKQKGIAGTLGIVVAAIAIWLGADFNPPSVEQYSEETNIVEQLTGQDVVYWTKSGSVFHVCSAVPDVNKESKDGKIYEGTVADAHAAGKERLTMKWESEAVSYCGYTQEQVDAAAATTTSDESTSTPDDSTSEDSDSPEATSTSTD